MRCAKQPGEFCGGVDQHDGTAVINAIAEVIFCGLVNLVGNAEATGQHIQLFRRSSGADECRIEICHVAGELFGLIALWVYRDKIHLQAITQL